MKPTTRKVEIPTRKDKKKKTKKKKKKKRHAKRRHLKLSSFRVALFLFSRGVISSFGLTFFRLFAWRYFVCSRGVISSFRMASFSVALFCLFVISSFRVALFRVFFISSLRVFVFSDPLSAQRRLWSDWADAQADLSLRWVHTHFVGFVMSWLIYWILLLSVDSTKHYFR